jgi:hypothetical protein
MSDDALPFVRADASSISFESGLESSGGVEESGAFGGGERLADGGEANPLCGVALGGS